MHIFVHYLCICIYVYLSMHIFVHKYLHLILYAFYLFQFGIRQVGYTKKVTIYVYV
jgi:hypothetical protein